MAAQYTKEKAEVLKQFVPTIQAMKKRIVNLIPETEEMVITTYFLVLFWNCLIKKTLNPAQQNCGGSHAEGFGGSRVGETNGKPVTGFETYDGKYGHQKQQRSRRALIFFRRCRLCLTMY